MRVISQISELREAVQAFKVAGERVGFVPTMGNLHAGHLDLVSRAGKLCQRKVVSIFVNPTQFDRADDLSAYPRTLEADLKHLDAQGVDLVFYPNASEMYPQGGLVTQVDIPSLSSLLEGSSRPGHFRGVATVVCKLFNIVAPDVAVFGQKDFQQLMVIRQMVADLNLPVEIIGAPTVREADGLAMSSRNNRLTPEQRSLAPNISRVLRKLEEQLKSGERGFEALQQQAVADLEYAGLKPDYITVCNAATLTPAAQTDKDLVILAAAYLGDIRLIDNVPVSLS